MAIYKSSFNKNKQEPKEKVEKVKKEKPIREKPTVKTKVNPAVIGLIIFGLLFIASILPNNFLKSFMLGIVGLAIYPISILGIFFCGIRLSKRSFNPRKKYITLLSCAICVVWLIFHIILTSKLPLDSYWTYLSSSYSARTTAGGIVLSLISYPLVKYLTYVGAYIVCGILFAIFVGIIIDYINVERETGYANNKSKFNFGSVEAFNVEEPEEKPKEVQVLNKEEAKKLAKQKLGLDKGESTIISSSMPTYDINLKQEKPLSKREYILTPIDPVIPTDQSDVFNTRKSINPKRLEELRREESKLEEIKPINPIIEEEKDDTPIAPNPSYSKEVEEVENNDDDLIVDDEELAEYETAFETDATPIEESEEKEPVVFEDFSDLEDLNEDYDDEDEDTAQEIEVEEITPDLDKKEFIDEYAYVPDQSGLGSTYDTKVVRPTIDISKFNLPNAVSKPVNETPKVEAPKEKQAIPPYIAPPVDLLKYLDNPVRISDEELQDNIDRLEQVLDDFKVPAKVNNVQVGPAVTRYELTMPRGISVNKIAQMADDIAMTLASNGAIRVEAPIPGKNSVGIEVPNKQVSPVSLRELVDSEEFRNRGNPLSFVLGRDINGDIIFCNLDKMPHVLVAGSTGSGKSVCLNTMLLSMCYKAGPQDLRLILVDPKMVEFTTYNGLPHLLIPEVITGKDMTINALDWSIHEMERRYAMFAKNRVVNISEFNKSEAVKSHREEKIPYIVIVVDELADLMLEAKREIDDRINKLAAKARAAGIHLVLATQRPSVDVITGTVKANLPSRIAFALTNFMDSKTILDQSGAEKLLGKGDMLFRPQDKPEPFRVQGAYVSNEEIYRVVEFIKDKNNPVYDDDAGRAIKNPHQNNTTQDLSGAKDNDFDPVLKDALKWFIQVKQASGSMISRRFSVGFNRAGRIMDQMEQAGFIGHQEGSKPRQVLITMDEFRAIFGDDE
ncbi:MAG: DNA translocase FtsK [Clostridia bacterium]